MEGNLFHSQQLVLGPPSGQVLSLLTALSNPAGDHARHAQALAARDAELCASPERYGNLCLHLVRILGLVDIQCLPKDEFCVLQQSDPTSALQLQHDPVGGWLQLRQMSGLVLKNALLGAPLAKDEVGHLLGGRMKVGGAMAVEIKQVLLQCLMDPHPAIRRVASTTISSSVIWRPKSTSQHLALPLSEWPELMPTLVQHLSIAPRTTTTTSTTNDKEEWVVSGVLLTLSKMIEDAMGSHQLEQFGGPAYARVVPLLLDLLNNSSSKEHIQKDCLTCLIGLIGSHDTPMPGELVVRMSDLLHALSALASSSAEIRTLVCRAIVTLLEVRTEYLQPHMSSIAEFMLTSTSSDPEVALEACEFWLTFGSLDDDAVSPDMVDTIRLQILPRLIPILLQGMVYDSDKQEELMEQNQFDASTSASTSTQQQSNLAPIFHKTKSKGTSSMKTTTNPTNDDSDDNDSDSNDDDDDDDDDDEMNEWSLRKCCAASLDAMANLYGPEDILPHLLPALQQSLSHDNLWVREAGVLALGAIAEGCEEAMKDHLPQLHPFLMNQLTSNQLPQLQSISAWTLGRYAHWAVDQVHTTQPNIVRDMTHALMGPGCSLNVHPKVQIASCSAFGVLVETAGDLLCPHLEFVLTQMVHAINHLYGPKSMMVLLDTMGTMSDFIGPAMGEANLPNLYLPPLLHMWTTIAKANPFDRTTLPLMETLASIALNIEIAYQPWALPTFETAMMTIESCLLYLSTQQGGTAQYDDEDADPIICAIDLLDGMTEGLNVNFLTLVQSSARYAPNFVALLHTLTGHDVPGVRMSAFALLGDLARQAPTVIQDGLGELLNEAIANIDPIQPSVCNNAVWAIGEICVQCQHHPPSLLAPYAPDLLQNLLSLLMGNQTNIDTTTNTNNTNSHRYSMAIPGLAENAAATMGRLAKVSPTFVAPELTRFLPGWCDGMTKISDPTERQDAFQGFLLCIHANPQSIVSSTTSSVVDTITSILFAIVSWHIPPNTHTHTHTTANTNTPELTTSFPTEYAELGQALVQLVQDLKSSVDPQVWNQVQNLMPVTIRQFMRNVYHM